MTLGDVTAESYDCNNPGPGSCCNYDFCFSPEQAAEVFRTAAEPAEAAGAGPGGAGPALACPPAMSTHLSGCTIATTSLSDTGECCYRVFHGTCCGRALIVEGEARQGQLRPRADWCETRSWRADAELPDDERAELAAAWAEDALMEHASVASFARFALELLGAGAPASLIEDAQRASLDEIVHARLCFGLASGFAGRDLGPSALNLRGVELERSLADLAVAVLLEGAVGETLAAALAREQLTLAGDARCREALEVIARDEAAHALLAWRFLRYAVDRGGANVVERLRSAARGAPRQLAEPTSRMPADVWNHYGRLTSEQQRRAVDEAWREVIAPAVQLLCGEPLSLHHHDA